MTIAERCASCFEPEIWARGLSVYEQGQVKVTLADAARVMATVASRLSPKCEVILDVHDRPLEIEATCTCQDYSMGRLCHHIWATILAVDEMGWLQDGSPLSAELIVSHQDVSIEPDHNLSQARHHKRLRSGSVRPLERRRGLLVPRRQALRPPVPESPGPSWQDYLLRIRQQTTQRYLRHAVAPSSAALPPRRAWYVCNVERSLQAGGLVLAYHHQERLANGTWGPIKARGVARSDVPAYEAPADQRLLHLLLGQPPDRPESSAASASPPGPQRATHSLWHPSSMTASCPNCAPRAA